MRFLEGQNFVPHHLISDLDDTLADSCKPINKDVAMAICRWLVAGGTLAIITMQSLEEVLLNLIEPLREIAPYMEWPTQPSITVFTSGGSAGYRFFLKNSPLRREVLYESNIREIICNAYLDIENKLKNLEGSYILRDRHFSISLGISKAIDIQDRIATMFWLESYINENYFHELDLYSNPVNYSSAHILPKGVAKSNAIQWLVKNDRNYQDTSTCIVLGDDFSDNGLDLGMRLKGALHISVGKSLGAIGSSKFKDDLFIHTVRPGYQTGYSVLCHLLAIRLNINVKTKKVGSDNKLNQQVSRRTPAEVLTTTPKSLILSEDLRNIYNEIDSIKSKIVKTL